VTDVQQKEIIRMKNLFREFEWVSFKIYLAKKFGTEEDERTLENKETVLFLDNCKELAEQQFKKNWVRES